MNPTILTITRLVGFLGTLWIWIVIKDGAFSEPGSLFIIVGFIILVFPVVWLGRRLLEAQPTIERQAWITSAVHVLLMILFGGSVIEALKVLHVFRVVTITLPGQLALILLLLASFSLLLTVMNLALSGLGAPFAVVLSRRLADRWMYRWTRNPMVLCTLVTLLAGGLYVRSLSFILWVILFATPAWIYYLKVYEERELEIRFGTSYLEYKSRTPFLLPGRGKRKSEAPVRRDH